MSHALPDEAGWRRLVDRALAGRPFSDLTTRTDFGLVLQPLYPAGHGRPIAGIDAGGWLSITVIDATEPLDTSAAALEALRSGADGLMLVIDQPADDLSARLDGVLIEACPIFLQAEGLDAAASLDALVRSRRLEPVQCRLHFGLDPIGQISRSGKGLANLPQDLIQVSDAAAKLLARGYGSPLFRTDGRIAHEAGADAATELAFALSGGVAYLSALLQIGVAETEAIAAIEWALSADAVQFETIAKFRAARLLWDRVLTAAGLPRMRLWLHGETSRRMLTRFDAESNAIRSTIAAFAAGAGGANSISVRGHDGAETAASVGAIRLASNTTAILRDEAKIVEVADPSAGSGAIEAMTLALCGAAWTHFQAIEAEGGLPTALASGSIQQGIHISSLARAARLRDGTDAIIGTTLHRATSQGLKPPSTIPDAGDTEFEPLRPIRTAAPFEQQP